MNITGIITEFNPLHRGHEHILRAARDNGADGIVCVMSGNFVQRGDAAIFNKFDRAECAVRSGADLIIELPVGYCLSSAQTFAYGGVALLESLGCVDTLMFGSECGDIEILKKTAAALNSVGHEDIRRNMSLGVSYAAAVGAALRDRGLDLCRPNDILASEYLRAVSKLCSSMRPQTVKRTGSYHDGGEGTKGAEEIRNAVYARKATDEYLKEHLAASSYTAYKRLVSAGKAPAELSNADRAVLYALRSADPARLENINGISEGLQNRIVSAAVTARSIQELFENVKTKRYTMTAVRRAVLCAWLGIKKISAPPAYARVLALNGTGAQILKTAKRRADIPITASLAQAARTGAAAKQSAEAEIRSGEAYAMLTPKIGNGREELTRKIRICE